jgi:DNA-binding MarR family transcriptional regulator
MDPTTTAGPHRTAFLLSQLGALASARFAERTRALGLTPADAGVLRLLGRAPGLNQRVLADRLGAVPSRIVALIDSLEARGLVERTRSSADRRSYELRLTENGQERLASLRRIAREHEAQLLGSLTPEQAEQLHDLLARLAAANSLDPDLHRNTGN